MTTLFTIVTIVTAIAVSMSSMIMMTATVLVIVKPIKIIATATAAAMRLEFECAQRGKSAHQSQRNAAFVQIGAQLVALQRRFGGRHQIARRVREGALRSKQTKGQTDRNR